MTINGVVVGAGTGADVMGHPFAALAALAWLANQAAATDRPLAAGDVVLTGSIIETRWSEPGDAVRAALEHLGESAAAFPP